MEDSGEVKEGFLCPLCMKDLGSQLLLQSHFVEAHSAGVDDDSTKNIKGIFDKAKRRILKKPGDGIDQAAWESRQESQIGASAKDFDVTYWEPQEFGLSCDLTAQFRKIRSQNVDKGMIEINTILIRLEKILQVSVDVKDSRLLGNSMKKAKEQSLVPWISDDDVKVCFGCKRSFSVARRKHHCRLCGQVICAKCSEFLPPTFAAALCKLDGAQDITIDPDHGKSDENTALRICPTCYGLLLRDKLFNPFSDNTFPLSSWIVNYQFRKEKQMKIPLVQLYERLTILISDADLLLPDFNRMAESLSLGDSRYSYKEVVSARTKLLKTFEKLDLISKKVVALEPNTSEDNAAETARESKQGQKLKKGIQTFVTTYLQNNMFTLKSIPSEDEFVTLHAERSRLLSRRAEKEKAQLEKAMSQRAMVHKEILRKERDSAASSPLTRRRQIEVSQKHNSTISYQSDPLLEQIHNVKELITKAKENGRREELYALETNLNELQREYNRTTR